MSELNYPTIEEQNINWNRLSETYKEFIKSFYNKNEKELLDCRKELNGKKDIENEHYLNTSICVLNQVCFNMDLIFGIHNLKPELRFAGLQKRIIDCSDDELISWYKNFIKVASLDVEEDFEAFKKFKEELPNRSKDFQDKIQFIKFFNS